MKICIIHPEIGKESAEELAEILKADVINPYKTERRDYREYDLLFNYGCNRKIKCNRVINRSKSVATCIDKLRTFKVLSDNNIPHPEYVDSPDKIPEHWDQIAVRPDRKGHQAVNIDYIMAGEPVPKAELYTQVYYSKFEFRIVVFMGNVVGRYLKRTEKEDLYLDPVSEIGFEKIDKACVKAAAALEIDYVGFDVLSRGKTKFVILEANSSPILTEESAEEIKQYFGA